MPVMMSIAIMPTPRAVITLASVTPISPAVVLVVATVATAAEDSAKNSTTPTTPVVSILVVASIVPIVMLSESRRTCTEEQTCTDDGAHNQVFDSFA